MTIAVEATISYKSGTECKRKRGHLSQFGVMMQLVHKDKAPLLGQGSHLSLLLVGISVAEE